VRGFAVLVAMGGFLLFEATAFWAHGQQRRVEGWAKVPARILASEQRARAHEVRFEYQMGKDTYTVTARHAAYPVGARVTAFVDPQVPARAVLDPRRGRQLVWMFALGGVAWLLVWAMVARAGRSAR
jgi:Protein of unknown function (DUF3592)